MSVKRNVLEVTNSGPILLHTRQPTLYQKCGESIPHNSRASHNAYCSKAENKEFYQCDQWHKKLRSYYVLINIDS